MPRVRLFGLPLMERDGVRSSIGVPPKAICLLALLAARANQPIMRDALAVALWPDDELATSRANLRRHLHLLTKALGDDIVVATRHTLQWNERSATSVDVIEFDEARDTDSCIAVERYGGPLCDGIADEAIESLRAEYERSYEGVLREAIATARAAGAADAERYLRRAVEQNPLDEEATRELMALRSRCGNRAGALRAYNELQAALRRELNVSPSPATVAVFESIAFDSAVAVPTNVVAPPTSIIGRDGDLDAVCALLGAGRSVTIVGSPGIGKSRLAVAAALVETHRYPDGVWRIDASTAATREGLIERLLITLGGSTNASGDEGLVQALAGKNALVVIDNCEHVRSEICGIISVLQSKARIALLLTSRCRIGNAAEVVHQLEPLSPTPAVRLFIERATAVAPAFGAGHQDEKFVRDIVAAVDRIPLAIELLAARAHMLSAAQMQQRVRSAERSHPAMERALAWSFDLLAPRERVLFARLAIFEDMWDLDAVEEICAGDGVDRTEIFPVLEALIDASLVKTERTAHDVRYRMLQPIHEYAAGLLSPESRERLRQRHADYYRDLAVRHHDSIERQDGDDFLRAMAGAGSNLLRALDTLSAREDARDAASLLAAASPFWGRRIQPQRVISLAERYIDPSCLSGFEPHLRGEVLRGAGRLAFGRGEWAMAEDLDLRAAEEYERIGERYHAITSRLAAAIAAGYYRLSLDERIQRHEAIAAELEAAGAAVPPWTAAGVQSSLSMMYHQRGDDDRALALALNALAAFREYNRNDEAAKLLTILTRIYVGIGQSTEAEECAREAVAIFRSLGERVTLAEGLRNLARAQVSSGRPEDDVYATLAEAIALMQSAPEPRFTVYVAIASFEALVHFKRYREAARTAGLVAALKERMHYNRPDEQLLKAELVQTLQRELGHEYDVLEQRGRSGSLGTLREAIRMLPSATPVPRSAAMGD